MSPCAKISIAVVLSILCIGCQGNRGPDDKEVTDQVRKYLQDLHCAMDNLEFAQNFDVENVVVKDHLIKDRDATIICELTAKVRERWNSGPGSDVSSCFSFLTNNKQLAAGQVFVSSTTFEFEEYDTGWRLKRIL